MKRFQSIIQKYITNHQKHKKYLAAVLALSILVSFAVPLSLIMPAISMTESESPKADLPDYNDGIMTLSAESEYPGAVNVTQADTFELYINVDDKIAESIYSAVKQNGVINGTPNEKFGEVTGDKLDISFNLEYRFSDVSDKFPPSEGSNRYMIVETNNLNFPNYPIGTTGSVTDDNYPDNANRSGTYTFKEGYILIEFNQDYIDWIYSGSNTEDTRLLGGTLNFEGNLSRDENGNGEQKFYVAGEEVSVKFSSRHPEVSNKSGSLTNPADGTITWQVIILNTYKDDLSSYVLTDEMLADATEVKYSPDNVGNHDEGSNKITFNSNTKNQEYITITYKTPIGNHNQGYTINNTATLTKTDDVTYESHKNGSVYLDKKPVEVSKSGTPDYNNGKIKWTITVTSNYGESLNGYQIVDEAFSGLSTVKVNDADVNVSGNTLTLQNIDGNVARIEYETTATEGDNRNSVYVKKGDDTKDKQENVNVTYKQKSELVELNKWGEYKPDTHEVEWTITITPENNYYLNGYELTDSQFPNDLSKFTEISCGSDKVEVNNGKLKFKDNSNVTGTVTIKYKTPVTLPEGTQTTAVSNDIDDNHRTSTVTAVVTNITARNSVSKNATGNTNQSVTSSGKVIREIGWKASITSDGKFAGKTYTDTLSVVGDGATHNINKDSANFILKAKSTQYGSEVTLTEGTDYTIDVASDGKSFEIKFSDNFDSSNTYNYVDITYNTIAELGSDYTTYQFKNGAGFNGATAEPGLGHSITRNNPISTDSMGLNVEKKWDSTYDENDKIPVTFKLQYRTGTYEAPYYWKDVHGSGEDYIFETDANYNSSNIYTIELDSNQNFKTWLSNLPRKTTETKENGETIETYYYYRVLEKNPDSNEYFENNGYFAKDGKLYSVTYTDDKHGINYDNSCVSVTNRAYKNINITPAKKWIDNSNNEITDNGRIPVDSITIELQRRTESDNTWSEWKTIVTSTLTKSGNWQFSDTDKEKYKNLPSAEITDGKLVKYEYKIVETKYDDKDIKDRNIVDDCYFEVTNNHITVTSDSNPEIVNKLSETKDQRFSVQKTWDDKIYSVDYSEHRPSSITFELQRRTDNSGVWETLESYTMKSPYDNLTTHQFSTNCPTQEISTDTTGNVTITKYDYKVVETEYTFNGKTVKLSSGTRDFITSGDGYWTIETTHANSSGEVAIRNRFVPYGETSVKPQKKWADDNDFTSNRKDVNLRLQWKLDSSSEWEDYKDSDGKFVERMLTSSNAEPNDSNTWTGDEITNLPKSTLVKSEVTENGETKVRYEQRNCQYRFVELGDDGEPLAEGASFKAEDGSYKVTYSSSTYNTDNTYNNTLSIITNTFKKDVGITKHLLDDNGIELPSSIDIEDLKQFKHGDYYIFNWSIRYDLKDWGSGDKLPTIKDTLPDGFELCTNVEFLGAKPADKTTNYPNHWGYADAKDAESTLNYWKNSAYIDEDESSYFVHPSAGWIESNIGCFGQPIDDLNDLFTVYRWENQNNQSSNSCSKNLWYYYDTTNNDVYFNKFEAYNVAEIYYAIKIKCTDLDAKLKRGTYTITNTAYTYDDNGYNTGNTEGSLTIVNNIPTGLIAKDGTEYEEDKNGNLVKSLSGYYNFSIDVNPEGKNLSNGDTIDIEDIFKTTGYFDNDKNGGYWEYSDKLVDILMNKITISEVDANGNKTALNKSEYVLKFDNSASVEGGTALMKLTVPDEKHLVIDYTYKMIANANTPSEKNACKSDIKEKGKRITMVPGLVPPGNDKISFKNTVSLKSDSVSDTANFTEDEYEFFTSNATSYTNKLPKIIKVNTGNTSINNLKANFFIAQYNQSTDKWKYATQIEKPNVGSSREAKITEWSEEYSGSYVPDNAAMIDVQTEYQIEVNLSQNALYKLIEVKVPDGYEGSNLELSDAEFRQLIVNYLNNKTTSLSNGKDYDAFLKNYVNTHYFVYNSVLSSYPDGIEAKDVIQVKQGEDVEIPNNQLINIGVGKEWNDSKNSDDSITVQLYWSYTKNTSKIPDDAEFATATDLGIMDTEFNAEKTLKMSEFNAEKIKESVWTDLPNGKDGKPIYYYIKETAYTIEGVTYKLDESDGAYKHDENKGAYYPIYVGNAANVASSNGTPSAVVQIKNTKNLVLKKAWKDSNNQPLTKGVPVSIHVSIYGTDKDTNEEILLFENIELSGNAWEANITDRLEKEDGTTINLSQYKSFRAEETDINADDYTISCVFNLNSNSGEITVTNKSKKSTSKSVTVDKVWSDGADVHKNDSIEVSLYRSTKEITGLTGLNQSAIQQKINDAGAVKMTDTADVKYTVDLDSTNGWSYTWTGLPMDDKEYDVNEYFYYVLETMNNVKAGTDVDLADKYTASYTATTNGAKTTFTVKNTRRAIKVQKEWYDVENELIPNEFIDEADGSVTKNEALNGLGIELTVSKKVNTNKPNPMVIHTFGDSITAGNGYNESGATYASDAYLGKLLKSSAYGSFTVSSFGWNSSDSTNTSQGGAKIFYLNGKTLNERDNVVCIMLGTNNIIKNTGYGSSSSDADLKAKIATLLGNPESDGYIPRKLFLANVPDFNYTSASSVMPTWSEWTSMEYHGFKGTNQEIEHQINNVVAEYNSYVKSVVTELKNAGYDAYFVDVNAVINKDTDLYDGCHLNTNGVDKMAQAFAEAINSSYTISDTTNSKIVTLNSDNNWTAVVDVDDDSEYYVTETKVTLNGEDVTDEWIASYENNGQKAESQTPVTIKNTKLPVPTTSVSVEKTWNGDNAITDASERAKIKLELWRTATPDIEDSWEWYADVDSQHSGTEDVWTYTCDNLPAKDNFGNTYYYKVVELDMDGYTVSYPADESNGRTSGTLHVKNTRTISLKFKKIWSDSETVDHTGETVRINVYRSTNPNDVPNGEALPQMLKVPENVSVGVNKRESVTANKDISIISVEPNDVITANADGKTINITGEKQGTATITVKDESGETATINVTVSALEMLLNGATDFKIEAGTTGTLSVKLNNNSTDDATFSSSDESVISVNGKTITAHKFGTADITATVGDVSITRTITVMLPSNFSITGDSEVTMGNEINLGIDKNYGTFAWSSSNDSIATVDQNGKVTGVSTGEVTITATRNDGTVATKTITVKNGDIAQGDVVVTLRVGDTVTLTSSLGINGSYDSQSIIEKSVDTTNGTITIKAIQAGTETVIFQDKTSYDYHEFTVTVLERFTVSPANTKLVYGQSVELKPNQSVTKYDITSGGDLISISGNTVTANTGKDGIATIRATNNSGETADITINVVEKLEFVEKSFNSTGDITYDKSQHISSVVLHLDSSNSSSWPYATIKFDDNNYVKVGYSGSADSFGLDSNGGYKFENINVEIDKSAGNATITFKDVWQPSNVGISDVENNANGTVYIYYGSASTQSYSMRSAMRMASSPAIQAEAGSEAPYYYGCVKLSASTGGNWTAILDNLDVYAPDGSKYYYWAVEETVSGYTASYYFDDSNDNTEYCIDATQLGSGEITIKNTKNESSSVEMPSTGGKGVKWYYLTGMVVMFASAAGILIRRRKNPVK